VPVEDVAVRLHDATPRTAAADGRERHEQPLNAVDLEARSSRPSKHSKRRSSASAAVEGVACSLQPIVRVELESLDEGAFNLNLLPD
jgi:hypothetical protein